MVQKDYNIFFRGEKKIAKKIERERESRKGFATPEGKEI
jgi:hypothetical protein